MHPMALLLLLTLKGSAPYRLCAKATVPQNSTPYTTVEADTAKHSTIVFRLAFEKILSL